MKLGEDEREVVSACEEKVVRWSAYSVRRPTRLEQTRPALCIPSSTFDQLLQSKTSWNIRLRTTSHRARPESDKLHLAPRSTAERASRAILSSCTAGADGYG